MVWATVSISQLPVGLFVVGILLQCLLLEIKIRN